MREQQGPIKEQRASGGNGYKSDKSERQEKPFFGNYDLVRRIDVGGMGEVYLAHQRTAFGREVAVKIMRSDLVHDATARKRFLREAEVSAHLKHEHILPLVEFGEERGRLFLVTPYIAGGTLGQRLESGPLALSEVHQLFTALVRAVAYIHKRGVIHRDLKPSNILLDQEDGSDQVYVRLIDFGISSVQGTAVSAPLTNAGNELGTLAYMAPERLDGVAAPSNDIYSLGVMLYQMLTGHLPTADSPGALPPPLEYVIKHCIAIKPSDRFVSADELLRVFEQAYRAVTAPKAVPATARLAVDDDTPRRVPSARATSSVAQESRPRVEAVAPSARSERLFSSEDYNAPTSFIDPQLADRRQMAAIAAIPSPIPNTGPSRPLRTRQKRKGSIFAAISFVIILIILVISMLGYYVFTSAITATVDITPQTHTFTKVLTLTAKPNQHSIDVGSASVPVYTLTSSKTGSLQGETTEKCELIFCQRAVDFSDVNRVALQLRQTLRPQVQQDISRQLQAGSETPVTSISYTDSQPTANPAVGTVSDTVTVNMTEQGSVEAYKSSDVQTLARMLLKQQMQQHFGAGYIPLDQFTQVGQPAVQGIDTNGAVTMQIAVGGVAQYQIPSSKLDTIQNHIKGLKEKDAKAYLMRQPGIDPNSVNIGMSYGDTLPSDVHQIKIVPLTPSNMPSVQLPSVKPAITPTQ